MATTRWLPLSFYIMYWHTEAFFCAFAVSTKTFQHEMMMNSMGAIVVFALATFLRLWYRTNSLTVVLGLLLTVVTTRAVDRTIRAKYVLTDGGVLLAKTGRVGLTKRVLLGDVRAVERRPFIFHLGYYALLEMMNNSVVSVQPDNVDNFLSALKKRLEKKDNEV